MFYGERGWGMTGETYLRDYIRLTIREQALKGLERAKEIEAEKERLVKLGKLHKKVTYDPIMKLTKTHYYV